MLSILCLVGPGHIFLSQLENFKLVRLPRLVLIQKLELLPWWLENRYIEDGHRLI